LAAASLTQPFERLGAHLEDDGFPVAFSFGGSSALVAQARSGAEADVLATADAQTMQAAEDAGVLASEPRVFARNRLTIAVPEGNPGDVTGLADDLSRPDLQVALCEPQVPCGAASQRLLEIAGVEARPDTLESDVKAAAGKVELGEVDAALVYRTDVTDRMEQIDVPEADQVVNEYLIAVLAAAPDPSGAESFIDAVTGEDGRRLLAEAGFELP
ncbi:MAG: molybdate ABC transporter substrate-binding protein, partial [Actinobacteria bacterium]|nr:molybdate ABC transporter substrate-binding protein [Actinomycetota bacterium]